MITDETISKLLRLKRYEQPPPEYFENFLRDFHRRQRAEVLRQSAWRIALGRLESAVSDLVGRFSVSQWAYGGASLAVLAIAGVLTVKMVEQPGATVRTIALNSAPAARAVVAVARPVASVPVQTASVSPVMLAEAVQGDSVREFSLDPRIRFPETAEFQRTQSVRIEATSRHPRYILDARPVSYEPPFSF